MYPASPQEPFPVPRGSARRAFTRHTETTHSAAGQGWPAKGRGDICRTRGHVDQRGPRREHLLRPENYCHLSTDM